MVTARMTYRERLADLLTGGALTRARDKLMGAEADVQYLIRDRNDWRKIARGNNSIATEWAGKCTKQNRIIRDALVMVTPKANATVRRMAKVLHEALDK